MKAILFANRDGHTLTPLTKKASVALLPIATKPTITYALDALLMTPIRDVIIVISSYGGKIEHLLGDGTHWNMYFTYALTRGQESPAAVLDRLGLNDDEYLLLRGDVLYDVAIESFLTIAQTKAADKSVCLTIEGQLTGICLLRRYENAWQGITQLNWDMAVWQNFTHLYPAAETIELAGKLSLLTSLQEFHQANLAILANQYPHLVLSGWQVHHQLLVGRRSIVPSKNQGIVGAFCRVHENAILKNAIVCDEVIIDSDTIIQNTVILPNTYIGKAVELNNAIVWGNMLIRLDNNIIVENVDSLLLANLNHSTLRVFLTNYFYRFLGLIIFICSLPLWPFAFLSALIENPRKPLYKMEIRGNLRKIDQKGEVQFEPLIVWEWQTSIPLFRHLPKLFAVIKGKIRLIGVSLETNEQAEMRVQPYEKIRDDTPVGLLSPGQMGLSTETTREEQLLIEAYYARTRHLGKDMLWLLRSFFCLFTKRAWWSSR